MPKTHGWPKKLLLILFWILIWQICSMAVKSQILLVGPLETLRSFSVQLFLPDFWAALGFSFGRICLGFFLAFFAGLVTGACAYWKPLIGEFLDPPIQFMKSIPVASFVILALIWLGGSRELSIVVSFIVAFPMIWEAVISGLSTSDRQLLEVSRTYEMGFFRSLRYIYLPALLPYLSTSLSSVIGMAFKSGVAAELIGQPTGTIGFYLYQSKVFLDTAGVFAWSLMVIMMSYICEQILKAVFKTASKRI